MHDTAANFLCQELRSLGFIVSRLVILPDDVSAISEEVQKVSGNVDVVLTVGGIGPTLDDVTVEGIAVALGTSLSR